MNKYLIYRVASYLLAFMFLWGMYYIGKTMLPQSTLQRVQQNLENKQ